MGYQGGSLLHAKSQNMYKKQEQVTLKLNSLGKNKVIKVLIWSIFQSYYFSPQAGQNHYSYLRSCHGNRFVLFSLCRSIFLRHSLSLKNLNSSETDIKPQRIEKWDLYFFSPPSPSSLQRHDLTNWWLTNSTNNDPFSTQTDADKRGCRTNTERPAIASLWGSRSLQSHLHRTQGLCPGPHTHHT